MTGRLCSLTRPGSVALVGASPDPTRPATSVLRGLLRGPARRLYPVNPRYESVLGVPCVPELAALPEPPGLTVVAVRAEAVLDTVRAAADVGARSLLVFSSGFAETDADGARRQLELRTLAAERGLTLLGPNSLGVIDFGERFSCSFASILDGDHALPSGPVALVNQSGAIGSYVYLMARALGLPMARFSECTTEGLRPLLPSYGSPVNPVDMTATLLFDPEAPFARCLELIEADEAVGEVVVFLGAGGDVGPQVARRIVAGVRGIRLRCSVIWLGVADDVAEILHSGGVAVFRGIEECIRPIALMARAGTPGRTGEQPEICTTGGSGPSTPPDPVAAHLARLPHAVLNEDESKRTLELAGFTAFPSRVRPGTRRDSGRCRAALPAGGEAVGA